MPSAAPKKPVRRAVKQIQTPIAPATGAAAAANDPSRHGLATVTIILLFLTVGCLAAATLVSEKMKTVEINAQTLAAQLDDSRAQNADLAEEVTNFKTLQALEKKVMAPPVVPADIVWDTYASPNLALQYPDGYAVVKATNAFPVLSIKSDKGGMLIFRAKDISQSTLPDGIMGTAVLGSGFNDDGFSMERTIIHSAIDPKVAPYNVWIYYGTGDDATKAVLDQAVGTIKVTK